MNLRFVKLRFGQEEGQHLVAIALILPVLFAFLGLVTDVGTAFVHQRRAQNAADAAAVAAAQAMCDAGESVAVAVETAYSYTAANGYDHTTLPGLVEVITEDDTIEVKINEPMDPIFTAILWNGTFPVKARAKAACMPGALGPSVIVLDREQCGALTMNGNNTRVRVDNGNIHVNSRCPTAADIGNGNVNTETPATIVGRGPGWTEGPNGGWNRRPRVGVHPLPDPLADVPEPDPNDFPPEEWYGDCDHYQPFRPAGSTTLSPGVYCGGILISGNGDIRMESGTYIMYRGDFESSGRAYIDGENVFIYLIGGSVSLAGTSGLNLTPPTDEGNPYAGILFFQQRGDTTPGKITGTSSLEGLNGIIYMRDAELTVSGTGDSAANFVVDQLTFDGNGFIDVEGWEGAGWSVTTSGLVE